MSEHLFHVRLPSSISLSLSFSLQSHFFSLSGGAKGILRSAIYPQLKNFSIENNKKLTRSSRTENGEKIKLTVLTLGLKLVTSLKSLTWFSIKAMGISGTFCKLYTILTIWMSVGFNVNIIGEILLLWRNLRPFWMGFELCTRVR